MSVPTPPAPPHVAIIMDGNGRWAKQRGLPRIEGHRRGVETVRATTFAARDLGVRMLTLYAFSVENRRRPEEEVGALMGLLEFYLKKELETFVRDRVRLRTIGRTGDLPTGFFQSDAFGHHGVNYGWGIGTCVLKAPHGGAAEVLSPGSFGHGGAWGTQAWIDPVKGVAYLLMVQRANFPNSDASDVRTAFQRAAADALRR